MRHRFINAFLMLVVILTAGWSAYAQSAQSSYPQMAPVNQYLMSPQDEIALARSAAPPSISDHAEILVMGRHDYTTAIKGTNGFVCMVERSWTAGPDAPDFWNPRVRSPFCLNPAAVRSYLPLTILKTRLALSGKSKAQIVAAVKAALDQKKIPPIERGAMCYMMSKQGYLSGADGNWHPHLMFFVPITKPQSWGANLSGSPLIAAQDPLDRITILMIPVAKWSDGTPDSNPIN